MVVVVEVGVAECVGWARCRSGVTAVLWNALCACDAIMQHASPLETPLPFPSLCISSVCSLCVLSLTRCGWYLFTVFQVQFRAQTFKSFKVLSVNYITTETSVATDFGVQAPLCPVPAKLTCALRVASLNCPVHLDRKVCTYAIQDIHTHSSCN